MPPTSLCFLLPLSVVLVPEISAAGSVLAFLDEQGVLVVVGDRSANGVRVERTGELGQFRVVGLGTTTINGGDEVVLVSEDLIVLLNGGNDRVEVDGNIGGSISLEGGDGNDALVLGCPAILGSAELSGGSGDDTFLVEGTFVGAGIRILGGSGNDLVDVAFVSIQDQFVIDTGLGKDEIRVFQLSHSGTLAIFTGNGSDRVDIEQSTISVDASIATRGGSDVVRLEGNVFHGRLGVDLWSGSDELTITANEVGDEAALFGGDGTDTLVDSGDNDFSTVPPVITGFEVGNPGNTTGPHLHFHLATGPGLQGERMPYVLDSFERLGSEDSDGATPTWDPTGAKPTKISGELPAEHSVIAFF